MRKNRRGMSFPVFITMVVLVWKASPTLRAIVETTILRGLEIAKPIISDYVAKKTEQLLFTENPYLNNDSKNEREYHFRTREERLAYFDRFNSTEPKDA